VRLSRVLCFAYGHAPVCVHVGSDTHTSLASRFVPAAREGLSAYRCGTGVYAVWCIRLHGRVYVPPVFKPCSSP
jgi:hypothetical protein